MNWDKANKIFDDYFFLIFLILIVLFAFIGMYIARKNKKPAEQNAYMNGDLYVKYPPDAYPNFPGSIV